MFRTRFLSGASCTRTRTERDLPEMMNTGCSHNRLVRWPSKSYLFGTEADLDGTSISIELPMF